MRSQASLSDSENLLILPQANTKNSNSEPEPVNPTKPIKFAMDEKSSK